MVRSGNLLRILLSKNVMIAKYKMNHRLALNDIAQHLNTFGAPRGTELERICIIMTALINTPGMIQSWMEPKVLCILMMK